LPLSDNQSILSDEPEVLAMQLATKQTSQTYALAQAQAGGLLSGDSQRVSARVKAALLEAAKHKTGLLSDTDVITYALARVATDNDFYATMTALQGKLAEDFEFEL
jgi:hypothetical protein